MPPLVRDGPNQLKIGYQGAFHADNRNQEGGPTTDLPLQQRHSEPVTQRLGLPNLLARALQRFYVQDKSTGVGWTMTGALATTLLEYYPEQSIGGPESGSACAVTWRNRGRDRLQRHHAARRVAYDVFATARRQ